MAKIINFWTWVFYELKFRALSSVGAANAKMGLTKHRRARLIVQTPVPQTDDSKEVQEGDCAEKMTRALFPLFLTLLPNGMSRCLVTTGTAVLTQQSTRA
jgi:hypothetical protein